MVSEMMQTKTSYILRAGAEFGLPFGIWMAGARWYYAEVIDERFYESTAITLIASFASGCAVGAYRWSKREPPAETYTRQTPDREER